MDILGVFICSGILLFYFIEWLFDLKYGKVI